MTLELCTRCGKCLTVCPTYRVFLSEPYSPRGRIALLEAGLEHPSFNECSWCEACSRACPHGISFPLLYFKSLFKGELKKDSLSLPSLFGKNPFFIYENLKRRSSFSFPAATAKEADVLIFVSCDVRNFYPKALKNFLSFLQKQSKKAASINAECCGIIYLIKRDFEGLKKHALKVVESSLKEKKEIVVFCATCWWMFKKIYPLILENSEEVMEFTEKIISAYAYLFREFSEELKFFSEKVLFHLPCHLTDERKVFKYNLEVEEFCCGSPRLPLLKMGFPEKYQKFWKKKLEEKDYLATFCIGCYLNFKIYLKEPPRVVHWLELLC